MAVSMFGGIRVLEVAEWTFVPAAGAVLAEFGADVIKVERPLSGDAQRGLAVSGVSPILNGVSLQMEASNRGGKRSIGIDISTEGGRDIVRKLAAQCDVFTTSLLPKTRRRFGLDAEDIRGINDRIIYAAGSGLGTRGPDCDKGGYDMTAYWCRSGLAYSLTSDAATEVVQMRPAIGDRLGAMNLVAGIASALFRRERTGEGATVDVSLLGTALWQTASDVVYSLGLDAENSRVSRGRNPMVGYYRTADARWLTFTVIEADRWWIPFAQHLGLSDLVDDPRYKDIHARADNFESCRDAIASAVSRKTLGEWKAALATFGGQWEPVFSTLEAARDPQVAANGFVRAMRTHSGHSVDLVAAPIEFDSQPGRLEPCPEVGANTEEILMELGIDWDEITAYKDAGFIN